MKKYCDLYYTIKKTDKGYVWYIREKGGEQIQSSLDNEYEDERYYEDKAFAEIDCRDCIEDHYV